jgi:tryptophan synthase alpha chain
MTYTNILYRKGYKKFIKDAKKAGIDGVILPDMPIEESQRFIKITKENGIDMIFLVSPNTPKERITHIIKSSSGFLYLVAIYGTTGLKVPQVKQYTINAIKEIKKIIKKTEIKIPIGIGFGVSTPDDVKRYSRVGVDGIIVGSAILRRIEEITSTHSSYNLEKEIASFTKRLKRATRT